MFRILPNKRKIGSFLELHKEKEKAYIKRKTAELSIEELIEIYCK